MNERVYRESRVKVTPAITRQLYQLVKSEDDFGKKKKHPAKWYRDEVAKALSLKESENPSLRSYEDALKPIRAGLRSKSPLDESWSVGACAKYPVSPEVMPLLAEMQKTLKDRITIRDSLWASRLLPLVKGYVGKGKLSTTLNLIANSYSELERLSEVTNWSLDTIGLDHMYFMRDPPADLNEGNIYAIFGPAAAESYRTDPKVNEYKRSKAEKDGGK